MSYELKKEIDIIVIDYIKKYPPIVLAILFGYIPGHLIIYLLFVQLGLRKTHVHKVSTQEMYNEKKNYFNNIVSKIVVGSFWYAIFAFLMYIIKFKTIYINISNINGILLIAFFISLIVLGLIFAFTQIFYSKNKVRGKKNEDN